MREKRPALLLAVAAALAAAACALLLRAPGAPEGHDAFQGLVGGLGLGPAVDLSRCAGEFDPRLEPGCSFHLEPVPRGSLFCPAHAGGAR